MRKVELHKIHGLASSLELCVVYSATSSAHQERHRSIGLELIYSTCQTQFRTVSQHSWRGRRLPLLAWQRPSRAICPELLMLAIRCRGRSRCPGLEDLHSLTNTRREASWATRRLAVRPTAKSLDVVIQRHH